MDKFEEIQRVTQQLHVHGGPKDVNDSSSDGEIMRTRILNDTLCILRSLLYYFWHKDTSKVFVHNNNHA